MDFYFNHTDLSLLNDPMQNTITLSNINKIPLRRIISTPRIIPRRTLTIYQFHTKRVCIKLFTNFHTKTQLDMHICQWIKFESRLLSHETPQLFLETREAHQYTKVLFQPMYIRHLSRVRIHARIRRFWTFVFTSSPSLRKSLYLNGLSVKASLPFFLHPYLHRRFWKFMRHAYFMHHKVINGHSAGRGRGRGGKIRKPENEVNKG